MAKDLYSVLGVTKDADTDTIKKTFRKLAAKLHPDRNPGDKAAEARFKEVNHAHEILADPKKRALYDEFGEDGLREGFDPEQHRAYRAWQQGGGRAGGAGGVNLQDLFGGGGGIGDVFGDLFNRGRSRGARRTRGVDVEGEVTIDFASSIRGATVQLTPRSGGEPIQVRIPPGAEDGARVRIAGHGEPAPVANGTAGDLVLVIHVKPHPRFRREGDDLHLELPLTVAEAYQGAKVRVPTTDGPVTMKVPARTQAGQTMRLRGKGVAKKGKPPGDLYVHFHVVVPTSDDPAVQRAIEEIAKVQHEDPREGIEL
jgi:curved DNA-binding protein